MAALQNQTLKQYFTGLTIIHGALVMGQVIFAGVAYYIHSQQSQSQVASTGDEITLYLTVAMAIAGVAGGHVISTSKIKALKDFKSLGEKLSGYRTGLILRYALLEGPSLFALVNYLKSGNITFLTISAMLVAITILFRPSKERAIIDLEPNPTEKKALEDPDAVL